MANWAQDDIVEHIQPEYHTMPYAHSIHLMTKKKCLKFTQNEYSSGSKRSYTTDNAPGHDPAKVRKRTSVPKRTPEKNAISEFISRLGMCKEIPDRKYCRKYVWKTLSEMDADLLGDGKSLKGLEKEMELLSEGDKIMASWIDDIFDEANSDGDQVEDEATIRQAAELLELFRSGNNNEDSARVNDQTVESSIGACDDVSGNDEETSQDDCINVDDNDDDNEAMSDDEDEVIDTEIEPTVVEFEDLLNIDGDETEKDTDADDDGIDDDVDVVDDNDEDAIAQDERSKVEKYQATNMDFTIGKGKKKYSCVCAKINPLCFGDIIAYSRKALIAKDLVVTRLAAKERECRKQLIREELYDEIKGNKDGGDTMATKESLGRLGLKL